MRIFMITTLLLVLTACSNPKDIVFGPEPLKEMAEKGDQFKKLPEEDRVLLAAYLATLELGKVFNADTKPVTGRTVGEVLVDAKAWKQKIQAQEAKEKARQAEADALAKKIQAERQAVADKISQSALVAIVGTRLLPVDWDQDRYSPMLAINYAITNKSAKTIKQIKGSVTFTDLTGDEIGVLWADIDKTILPGKTIETDTGRGFKLNEFMNEDKERIAGRKFSDMKAVFTPESIAFDDGEVIKAPELQE